MRGRSFFYKKYLRQFTVLFFNASVFLTRFPAPPNIHFNNALLQLSAVHFPLVGACVGLLGVFVYLVAETFWPPVIALILMLAACIFATGAFHEDGWADSCDAFGGGYEPKAILRIMKDSRLGTYGVMGLIVILSLKFFALLALTSQLTVLFFGFIAGQSLSRWLALWVIFRLDYVRDEHSAKAKPLAQSVKLKTLLFALFAPFFALISLVIFSPQGLVQVLISVALAVAGTFYLMRLFKVKLGGYTGDCLGAVQQFSEVLFYLGLSAAL